MSYIKAYRDLKHHWVFSDPRYFKFWMWILFSASYKTRHVNLRSGSGTRTITLNPGDLLYGRNMAEDELQMPGTTLFRMLQKFEKDGMISIETDMFGTRISVCNWESYQSFSDEDGTPTERLRNTYGTPTEHPRNAYGTPTEPYKESIEGIEGKESIEVRGHAPHTQTETGFTVIESELNHSPAQPEPDPKKGKRRAAVSTIFQKPEVPEMVAFMTEFATAQVMQGRTTGTEVDPTTEAEAMFNHFEANGWRVGRTQMRDWKAAARNWFTRSVQFARDRAAKTGKKNTMGDGFAAAQVMDSILFPPKNG